MKMKLPFLALAALLFAALPQASHAYIGVSVTIAPPAIPVYVQPYCPAPGYIWTPGYWDYDSLDYYWVPGIWVAPPRIGFLWTPGYWGYRGGGYVFNAGYWGPTVGFYGGINYGFGYGGRGYYGGEWAGNVFRYNTAVTRVDTTVIRNTYVNRQVINNFNGSRAGFNGPRGSRATPTAAELAAAKAKRLPATPVQRSRAVAAKNVPALRAANNHGKPKSSAIMALGRSAGPRPAASAANLPASPGKVKAGTAQASPNSRPAAKPFRSQPPTAVSPGRTPKAKTYPDRGNAPAARRLPLRPQAERHPQAVPRRPRPAFQPAPPPRGRVPAQPGQPVQPDKKKKNPNQAP